MDRLRCPVRVRCGVTLHTEDLDLYSRWHKVATGKRPISCHGRGIQRCCHGGIAGWDINGLKGWLEHRGVKDVVEGVELAVHGLLGVEETASVRWA